MESCARHQRAASAVGPDACGVPGATAVAPVGSRENEELIRELGHLNLNKHNGVAHSTSPAPDDPGFALEKEDDASLTCSIRAQWFVTSSLEDVYAHTDYAFEYATSESRKTRTVCSLANLKARLAKWYAAGKLAEDQRFVCIDLPMYNGFMNALWPDSAKFGFEVRPEWLAAFGTTAPELEKHVRNRIQSTNAVLSVWDTQVWEYESLVQHLVDIGLRRPGVLAYATQAVANRLRWAYEEHCDKEKRAAQRRCQQEQRVSDSDEKRLYKNAGQGKSKRKTPRKVRREPYSDED